MISAELKNVFYTYSKGTPFESAAVSDVSAVFESNMITGIIGHTGSGKSTVAQLINGLLPVSSGEVFVCGKNIWAEPKKMREVRFKAGLVFQYPEYQLFDETVYKDISFGPKNMGLSEKETDERVRGAAFDVGLDESLLEKSPFELSGGQKRRAAIAGVLAMRPQVLILDEPAAGLDPKGRREILGKIAGYKERTGAAVIMISHSMEDIAEYCDKIVVMSDSKVLICGTPREVFSHSDELMKTGLTVPQVTKVLCELKNMGYDVDTSAYTVKDAEAEILRLFGGEKKC